MSGTYEGRLMCDGYGNLLADESRRVGEKEITLTDDDGEALLDANQQVISVKVPIFKFGKDHGKPVAFHEGSYVFLNSGDDSHNERHHENFAEISGTQHDDETAPHYAGTADSPAEGREHHFGVLEDDPHYDAEAEGNTRLRFDADKVAATVTGHTSAYKGGEK